MSITVSKYIPKKPVAFTFSFISAHSSHRNRPNSDNPQCYQNRTKRAPKSWTNCDTDAKFINYRNYSCTPNYHTMSEERFGTTSTSFTAIPTTFFWPLHTSNWQSNVNSDVTSPYLGAAAPLRRRCLPLPQRQLPLRPNEVQHKDQANHSVDRQGCPTATPSIKRHSIDLTVPIHTRVITQHRIGSSRRDRWRNRFIEACVHREASRMLTSRKRNWDGSVLRAIYFSFFLTIYTRFRSKYIPRVSVQNCFSAL